MLVRVTLRCLWSAPVDSASCRPAMGQASSAGPKPSWPRRPAGWPSGGGRSRSSRPAPVTTSRGPTSSPKACRSTGLSPCGGSPPSSTRRASSGRRSTRRILAGETLTITEQQRWMNDDLRVPDLFHHLLDRGDEYRALVFAPYLFWTTFACGQVVPERTILMPCLHDEPEARLRSVRAALLRRGMACGSSPSPSGARTSHPAASSSHRGDRRRASRSRLAMTPRAFAVATASTGRFVLYAGRREGAKGWEALVDAFADAVARRQLAVHARHDGHRASAAAPTLSSTA